MKKTLFTSFFLLFIITGLNAQVDFTDSNLPIVVINTFGQDIIDEEKITCEMGIINNGPGMRNYLTDPYNDYFGDIGIELRGSTSQQYPKKSYGVVTLLPVNLSILKIYTPVSESPAMSSESKVAIAILLSSLFMRSIKVYTPL